MILITSAAGHAGLPIVQALVKHGVKCRALARDPKKAEAVRKLGIEIVQGDMMKPASLDAAFKGVEKLMLISPSIQELPEMEANAVAAAKRAGVKHVVKFSADTDPGIRLGAIHAESEKNIMASGLAWTFLKPTFFMQNFLGMAKSIKAGTIRYDGRDGKAAHDDLADVAAVAAEALTGTGQEGKIYRITGPAAMDYAQIATVFSKVLGRPVKYVKVTHEESKAAMIAAGESPWRAEGLAELAENVALGKMAAVTNTIRQVTGRAAKPLEQWVGENRAAFTA